MTDKTQHETQQSWHWHGLGGWNYYFIVKLALLWYGYLNFHPLANLVFLAFLLFPLPRGIWHRIRLWIALPVGLLLFYHDTWLPGINSIITQAGQVLAFSGDYKVELLQRMINWNMIGAAFVLLVIYLFVSQWIRVTVFTVLAVLWLNIPTLKLPEFNIQHLSNTSKTAAVKPAIQKSDVTMQDFSNKPPSNENIDAYLSQFYKKQQTLKTKFPQKLAADSQPFDIIFIHICSFAWSDIKAIHQENHPIWKKFDILFENFNGAATYSNPAALRLLQGSCGQPKFPSVFAPVDPSCYLVDQLAKLEFTPRIMLDHTGVYANFLKDIRKYGGLENVPFMSQVGISPELTAFYGGPIYSDSQTLTRWLNQRKKEGDKRNVTFFNIITLHDGNRSILTNKPVPFQPQGKQLLNEIDTFFDELNRSGRKAMVVFISAHGRNYTGDKIQMPGLRNIPTPDITHVPVGIKLIGLSAANQNGTLKINQPSSYQALSELISRVVDGKIFNQSSLDLPLLTKDLPQTELVSENEEATVLKYQGKIYIRLRSGTSWVTIPK